MKAWFKTRAFNLACTAAAAFPAAAIGLLVYLLLRLARVDIFAAYTIAVWLGGSAHADFDAMLRRRLSLPKVP